MFYIQHFDTISFSIFLLNNIILDLESLFHTLCPILSPFHLLQFFFFFSHFVFLSPHVVMVITYLQVMFNI